MIVEEELNYMRAGDYESREEGLKMLYNRFLHRWGLPNGSADEVLAELDTWCADHNRNCYIGEPVYDTKEIENMEKFLEAFLVLWAHHEEFLGDFPFNPLKNYAQVLKRHNVPYIPPLAMHSMIEDGFINFHKKEMYKAITVALSQFDNLVKEI